jgi:gas vesicle protein
MEEQVVPKEYESREVGQSKNTQSSNHFLLGALIGGLAGAAAALLFATKSGKELRSRLNKQAGSLMEKSAQLRGNVTNKSGSIVSKTQDLVQQSTLLNKAKSKNKTNAVNDDDSNIHYIPIGSVESSNSEGISLGQDEIRKRLLEAERALEEEENKVKQ